eukprot:CAMPEP_0178960410 /NCGR_PEP_ID=MMETSP0789-20121207/12950_1 /TAXON_ID=3005 /ORGANISM="Rhizosolenia setigera, Strain CCMP 1694" /LENGTH=132 /DNA_ID=CAMNT_0020643759 /DNA_START=66 /DNA_END=464 /DNA_ORIENTATION=+
MSGNAAKALAPLLRRSVVSTRATSSAVRGGSTPPLPPFARNLAPTEKLVEHHDLVWDDGVAPEVTIDYDASHISSRQGLAMWLGGFAFLAGVYNLVKLTDPPSKNPAVNRKFNMVKESPELGTPGCVNFGYK